MALKEISTDNRHQPSKKRRTISLRWLLALVFSALVGLSVLTVLGVSVATNFSNTFSLLGDNSERFVNGMVNTIRDQTKQAENIVVSVDQIFQENGFVLGDVKSQEIFFKALMTSAPIVEGIVIFDPQGRKTGLMKNSAGNYVSVSGNKIEAPEILENLKIGEFRTESEPLWGNPVSIHGLRYHNVSKALFKNGQLKGIAVALIGAGAMNRIVKQLGADAETTVFVMDHRENLIAHSKQPLLFSKQQSFRLVEFPDDVLAQLPGAKLSDNFLHPDDSSLRIFTTPGGDGHVYLLKELVGYSKQPYTLGAYFKKADIGDEVVRASLAAIAGLVTLVISVAIAVFIGTRLAKPMSRIADAADLFSNFELEKYEHLPHSRIEEIDNQAGALNAMYTAISEFSQYIPEPVVKRLVQSGVEGTRSVEREVTVMFLDIVGFTTLSEKLNATQIAELLNSHFDQICGPIQENFGTIDKFMGDGVMAFWGAPNADNDHAKHAVIAVGEIQQILARENINREKNDEQTIKIRVGIHTGRAVVGNIGGGGRKNYTIVGDTVNIAQRLEQLGKEVIGEHEFVALASEAAVKASGELDEFDAMGSWKLRGRDRPVSVFSLRGDETRSGKGVIEFPAQNSNTA